MNDRTFFPNPCKLGKSHHSPPPTGLHLEEFKFGAKLYFRFVTIATTATQSLQLGMLAHFVHFQAVSSGSPLRFAALSALSALLLLQELEKAKWLESVHGAHLWLKVRLLWELVCELTGHDGVVLFQDQTAVSPHWHVTALRCIHVSS